MIRLLFHAAAFLAIGAGFVNIALAERHALVMGNDSYQHISVLKNSRADARAIARVLEGAGFRVSLVLDQNRNGMHSALRSFKDRLSGGDDAVFVYAGHGVQLGGANYLLPVDVKGDSEGQVRDDALHLQRVLDDLAEQKPRFSLAIIDACRDNPFKGQGRNFGSRGLAPTTAANGQMVIFSAGGGQQALDRLGESDTAPNGLFARVFVKEMATPGVPVHDLLRKVRDEVVRQARSIGHDQMPAIYDQSVGQFYFLPAGVAKLAQASPGGEGVGPLGAATTAEAALWQAVRSGNTMDDYQAYLDQYPQGQFVALARKRMEELAEEARVQALRRDTEAWNKAESLGSREGYRAYLKNYSGGTFSALAQARLKRLEASGGGEAKADPSGKSFRDCPSCPEMIAVPGGSFQMGSKEGDPEERPVHRVTVPAFSMGKTEVTVAQWKALMGGNPPRQKFQGCDECPVDYVSVESARAFLQALSDKTGRLYRLPSEAEWEYACRAGGNQTYCGSNDDDEVAWHSGNSGGRTHPVGRKAANAFGLHDMSGNVFELIQDCANDDYTGAPTDGKAWMTGNCSRPLMRGGSFDSGARLARASARYRDNHLIRTILRGFRVVAQPPKD